jgi:predicted adenine nucleotide alpha hydrolase (AANH) superfamily ATPase
MANRINYDLEMERLAAGLPAGTPLLLHACCAPCASAALGRLCRHFEVTIYYYNPNLAPPNESRRRLAALDCLLEAMPLRRTPRLLKGIYDPERFLHAARGLEAEAEGGARCRACFALRLDETARQARALGIEWFASTLSAGPRKRAEWLEPAGQSAAAAHGRRFLSADFKKKGGAQLAVRLCRQYGLYRQSYCGCPFSSAQVFRQRRPGGP